MALGGILLSNYIFMMLLGSISMFIMALTVYIILSILRKKKEERCDRKTDNTQWETNELNIERISEFS